MKNTLKRYWPEAVVFILELVLLAIGADLYKPTDEPIAISTLVTLQIGVFVIYLTAKGVIFERATGDSVDAVKEALNEKRGTELEIKKELEELRPTVNSIRALSQWEFYERFGQRIENATDAVDITHLDKHPPDENIAKTRYFEEFVERIKRNPSVNFRRLERVTPEKLGWIQDLLRELEGHANFSMRAIVDAGPEKLPHISVQLIDRKEVYLVAVAAHRSPHGPRDMLIDSSDAYSIWHDYFERVLWERAEHLMHQGRVLENDPGSLIDRQRKQECDK